MRGPVGVSTGPIRATANPPPPCGGCLYGTIPRYTKYLLAAGVEFLYDDSGNCQYQDPGSWSAPASILPLTNPLGASIMPGTVDVTSPAVQGPIPINPDTGKECLGGGTYMYGPLYFTWTLHTNDTAAYGYGPFALFTSTWAGTFGKMDTETFQVTVPVVRPIGETTDWAGWANGVGLPASFPSPNGGQLNGTQGQWMQTLTAPPNDSSFDFSNEWVQETFVGGRNTCPRLPTVAPHGLKGSWLVFSGNIWGPDSIGTEGTVLGYCSIMYSYCYGPHPCGFIQYAQMGILSPADTGYRPPSGPFPITNPSVGPAPLNGYTDYLPQPNELVSFVDGRIIGSGLPFGTLTSQRGPNGTEHRSFVSPPPYSCQTIKDTHNKPITLNNCK
jgi:hypothetical protein